MVLVCSAEVCGVPGLPLCTQLHANAPFLADRSELRITIYVCTFLRIFLCNFVQFDLYP